MTIKNGVCVVPRTRGVDKSRALRNRFMRAFENHKQQSDEGSLLIEVLVGMLILIIVFTATTVALSNMADERVQIEQRDRALAIVTNYEEQSRVFGCGFMTDRISDSLSRASVDAGTFQANSGTAEFASKVTSCDFHAKDGDDAVTYGAAKNAGDQDFDIKEPVNDPALSTTVEVFHVKIRYWWEDPGTNLQTQSCSALLTKTDLPLILARGFEVSWQEKGFTRTETLIKRDPVPSDDVVFASGNRVTIVVPAPSLSPVPAQWYAALAPVLTSAGNIDPSMYIEHHIDSTFSAQPKQCVWFPYITADGANREAEASTSAITPTGSNNVTIPDAQDPQTFVEPS